MAKKEVKEAEVVKEAKATKKSAAKNSTKKADSATTARLTAKSLREMDEKALSAKLTESQNDLNEFHKMARANELPSSHVIAKTRREIARIHTILTEKEFEKEAENE